MNKSALIINNRREEKYQMYENIDD